MGDLTENFSRWEFVHSDSYPELANKIPILKADVVKFNILSTTILQPLRNHFKKPIRINSGKRSKLLNDVVGGVSTSEHRYRELCAACDFQFIGSNLEQGELWKAYKYIREKMSFAFGQLILYLNEEGEPRFIHVSLPTKNHTGECLLKRPDGYEKFLG